MCIPLLLHYTTCHHHTFIGYQMRCNMFYQLNLSALEPEPACPNIPRHVLREEVEFVDAKAAEGKEWCEECALKEKISAWSGRGKGGVVKVETAEVVEVNKEGVDEVESEKEMGDDEKVLEVRKEKADRAIREPVVSCGNEKI